MDRIPTPDPAKDPRTPWRDLILLFLASRAAIWVVAWLSLQVVTPGQFGGTEQGLLGSLRRWDTTWFLGIADGGYNYIEGQQSTVAFFPLYPWTVRAIGTLVGGNTELAGYLVSNLALFGCVVLLWKLAEDFRSREGETPRRGEGLPAVRLLLFGPVSFFFSIVYTEALFLVLTLACIYAARRRVWWIAGLAGFGAALTRNAGVFLVVPILLEYFDAGWRRPFLRRPGSLAPALWSLLPTGGLATWAAFLAWKFGDPMLFTKVQGAWARRITWPWQSFESTLANMEPFYRWWFVAFALLGIALFAVAVVVRLRPSLLAYGGMALLLNLSAGHLESIPRLLSAVFPLYLAGAALISRCPRLEAPLIAMSGLLLGFSTLLFVNGYWFT